MTEEPRSNLRLCLFGLFAASVVVLFLGPVSSLFRLAWKSQLYSHALLVPAISAWFVFRRREPLPPFRTSPAAAAAFFLASGLMIAWAARTTLLGTDLLAIQMTSLLLMLGGVWMLFLGSPSFRELLFPLLFMLFLVPLPGTAVHLISIMLQDGSASLSHWTFAAMGWPIFRSGHVLILPGLTLEVAEECSGINSTFALFITSVLAGQLLLKSPWKRALFVGVVLPLGILRNTFRIVSLAILTIKVDRRIIDSPLHHHGGPIFFALSLIPLFALLIALWWSEKKRLLAETGVEKS